MLNPIKSVRSKLATIALINYIRSICPDEIEHINHFLYGTLRSNILNVIPMMHISTLISIKTKKYRPQLHGYGGPIPLGMTIGNSLVSSMLEYDLYSFGVAYSEIDYNYIYTDTIVGPVCRDHAIILVNDVMDLDLVNAYRICVRNNLNVLAVVSVICPDVNRSCIDMIDVEYINLIDFGDIQSRTSINTT